MKRMTVMILLSAFFLLVAANPVCAQDNKWYLGLYGVWAIESIDEAQTQTKFSVPVQINYDDSWGLQGRGGYIFNEYFTLEGMIEYQFGFDEKINPGAGTGDMKTRILTLNAKITCPAYETFKPYIVIGAGGMCVCEEITYQASKSKTKDTGFMWRGGAGFDYYFTPSLSGGIEGAYTAGAGSVDHMKYIAISFGLSYHF
jgi:opacity protein-like surface antigen